MLQRPMIHNKPTSCVSPHGLGQRPSARPTSLKAFRPASAPTRSNSSYSQPTRLASPITAVKAGATRPSERPTSRLSLLQPSSSPARPTFLATLRRSADIGCATSSMPTSSLKRPSSRPASLSAWIPIVFACSGACPCAPWPGTRLRRPRFSFQSVLVGSCLQRLRRVLV